MTKGLDTTKAYTSVQLDKLAKYGYTFITRYLSHSTWKALTADEAIRISKSGLWLVSIYQSSANSKEYFSYAKGVSDAHDALQLAKGVGQPSGSTLYFAVDYETTKADIANVQEYFKGVSEVIVGTGYGVGVYGSYYTVTSVTTALFKFQTIAWSYGKICDYTKGMYQFKCDTVLPEDRGFANVDLIDSKGNAGGWKVKI